jgi:hypothetical protein
MLAIPPAGTDRDRSTVALVLLTECKERALSVVRSNTPGGHTSPVLADGSRRLLHTSVRVSPGARDEKDVQGNAARTCRPGVAAGETAGGRGVEGHANPSAYASGRPVERPSLPPPGASGSGEPRGDDTRRNRAAGVEPGRPSTSNAPVGTKGLDGNGRDVRAGRGRRPLVNPSPNHNSQRQLRTAGTGGLTVATRSGAPRAALEVASSGAGGGGVHPHAPSSSCRETELARSLRDSLTEAKPVEPTPCRLSDPGSIPGVSTIHRKAEAMKPYDLVAVRIACREVHRANVRAQAAITRANEHNVEAAGKRS